jgi:transposase
MTGAIGIDTHRDTLAACALDALGRLVSEQTFRNDPAGHTALAAWARSVAPDARIGVEGSSSFGAALARALLAAGLLAVEVPPQLSRRERAHTRRAGKSDPGDALAIARVTLREAELPPVRVVDRTHELALLTEAKDQLTHEATRIRNRLHAHLRVLLPGYATDVPNLVAACHRRTVGRRLRRVAGVEAELARSKLARLGALVREERELTRRIARLVARHPLGTLAGAGPLTTGRLVGETGDVDRFRNDDAFAAISGTSPIPASSGLTQRMRLNRGGNRQLNRAIHTIAVVQGRSYPPAQAFLARKTAEGKTDREARRALKRHLARTVFRLLREGQAMPSWEA